MHASIRPTMLPRRRALRITEYCSYIKQLRPYAFVKPIALRQPYSQTLSRILLVVLIRSRKNAKIRAIAPTIRTKMLKTLIAASSDPTDYFLSSRKID